MQSALTPSGGRLWARLARWLSTGGSQSGFLSIGSQAPAPGRVRWGSLRRLAPISRKWGNDRGRSIYRGYIEQFLSEHERDIRGSVLEFGDDRYTSKVGGNR